MQMIHIFIPMQRQVELNEKLNHDMVNIKHWCMDNNMTVNQDKTKAMWITIYRQAIRLETKELNVTYDGSKLQNVDSENLLGIKIDKNLSWKDQVDKVANKVSCGIALLRRINDYLLVETWITYYKTFIQPHIDYCNIIWGQSNHIAQVYKLQKMAYRIIHNKPKLTPSNPFFQENGLLPIETRESQVLNT